MILGTTEGGGERGDDDTHAQARSHRALLDKRYVDIRYMGGLDLPAVRCAKVGGGLRPGRRSFFFLS